MTKLAEVEPLPNIKWSSQAALGDAMQRVKDSTTPLMVMWIEDGQIKHSCANVSKMELVWMCEAVKLDSLTELV